MDRVTLTPFLEDLQGYNLHSFRRDSMAAITTAIMALPQSMAYAVVADLPLQTGIYASIFGTIFGAAFGASRHLIMGPTSAVAILILSGTSEVLYTYYNVTTEAEKLMYSTQIVMQLAVIIGIIQIVAGMCKLGRLTQFASRSVILGYIAGVAIATAVNQLFYFLGVPRMVGNLSVWEQMKGVVRELPLTHWPTVVLGVVSLAFLITFRRFSKKVPIGAILLIGASFIIYAASSLLPKEHMPGIATIKDIGNLNLSWPTFSLFSIDMRALSLMLPLAFTVSLLGILEATSIARVIAANSGQRPSKNQEIFALGIANIASAISGGMPCSGSFSRSITNFSLGAKTRFAAMMSGGIVLVILYGIGGCANWIPLTTLAALILITCSQMIDWAQLATCFRATKADSLIVCVTPISSMIFSLDVAFYIGVVLSVILYLRRAASPGLVEYTVDENNRLHEVDPSILRVRRHEICVLHVEGELFFGAVDLFQEGLIKIAEDQTVKVIIIDMRNALNLDATACIALQRLHTFLTLSGRGLICCDISPDALRVLNDAALIERLGPNNLFMLDIQQPHWSLGRAIRRAREIVLLEHMDKKEEGPVLPAVEAL